MKMDGGSAPERDREIAQVSEPSTRRRERYMEEEKKRALEKERDREERIEKVENMPSYSFPWATLSN